MSAPFAQHLRRAGAGAVVLGVVAWVVAPYLLGERIVAERDALSAVIPAKLFVAESFAQGEMPWWNPLPAFGKPFFADPLPGVLYPGNLLLLVRPFAHGFGLFVGAQYLWTAAGAFLCLRTVSLQPLAAGLGALVWALGGAMLSLANVANHLSAAAWLPWVMYGWSRPRVVPERIAGAAVAMAPVFLAGSPEMVVLAAGGLLLWSSDWRAIFAPLLAVGIAAVGVVPILSYLGLTYRGAVAFEESQVMRLAATPAQLVQLVWPSGPLEPETFLASVYVGPLAVGFAVVGLVASGRRRSIAVGGALLVVLLVALGPHTPALPALVRLLPGAGLVRYPGKALVAVHALIASGAAFGLAHLQVWSAAKGRPKLARQAVANLLPLLVVVAVLQIVLHSGTLLSGERPEDVLAPPAIARAMRADAPGPLRYFSNTTGLPAVASPAEGLRLDRELLLAATGELYGLGNVNTPSSLNLVAHEILQRALTSTSRERALGALAALGTSYVSTWIPLEGESRALEVPLGDGARGHLYRLEGVAARAFFARHVVEATDALGAAGRFVLASSGNHDGLAVLEVAAARSPRDRQLLEAVLSAPRAASGGAVRLIESGASRLVLEAQAAAPALLVINDTWVPGWSATANGSPIEILRVNGLVRGVALGPGTHRIEMRYRPPGLAEGLLFSLASGLTAALLMLLGRRRRRALGNPKLGSLLFVDEAQERSNGVRRDSADDVERRPVQVDRDLAGSGAVDPRVAQAAQ